MTLRIDTSAFLAVGRDLPAVTTGTKTKKSKFIEFPKTQEIEQAADSKTETKNKKTSKKDISDDEILDIDHDEKFRRDLRESRKKRRVNAEKEWEENIKNAKTPEEKAKQKEIYDSRMNYKKAVIENKKTPFQPSFDTFVEECRERRKKLQAVKDNVRADNGMTLKGAHDRIAAIYQKYRSKYSEMEWHLMESRQFYANPDGKGGYWYRPEIEDIYGMSDADRAAIKEAKEAIAQIEKICELYE